MGLSQLSATAYQPHHLRKYNVCMYDNEVSFPTSRRTAITVATHSTADISSQPWSDRSTTSVALYRGRGATQDAVASPPQTPRILPTHLASLYCYCRVQYRCIFRSHQAPCLPLQPLLTGVFPPLCQKPVNLRPQLIDRVLDTNTLKSDGRRAKHGCQRPVTARVRTASNSYRRYSPSGHRSEMSSWRVQNDIYALYSLYARLSSDTTRFQ